MPSSVGSGRNEWASVDFVTHEKACAKLEGLSLLSSYWCQAELILTVAEEGRCAKADVILPHLTRA